MSLRPFRFGLSLGPFENRTDLQEKARAAEAEGWSTLHIADHLNFVAPFPALASAAAVTDHIRLGTLVVNNDWRSLAILAQDAATTDLLSDGRLELGLGTGYAADEYLSGGYELRSGKARVDGLRETIVALRSLFGGKPVSSSGNGPTLADHSLVPLPPQREELPLLVGGNGDRLLKMAAQHADIVAFTGFSFPDGRAPRLSHVGTVGLLDRVSLVERAASEAGRSPERNLLVQFAAVGTRAQTEPSRAQVRSAFNISDTEIDDTPVLLIGESEQIVEKVLGIRERFGINYLSVLEPRASKFAAVVERLANS